MILDEADNIHDNDAINCFHGIPSTAVDAICYNPPLLARPDSNERPTSLRCRSTYSIRALEHREAGRYPRDPRRPRSSKRGHHARPTPIDRQPRCRRSPVRHPVATCRCRTRRRTVAYNHPRCGYRRLLRACSAPDQTIEPRLITHPPSYPLRTHSHRGRDLCVPAP